MPKTSPPYEPQPDEIDAACKRAFARHLAKMRACGRGDRDPKRQARILDNVIETRYIEPRELFDD